MQVEQQNAAWVFPGQGSQKVGMGKMLAEAYPVASEVFAIVDKALDFPLSDVIFNGPDEALVSTRNQQPAILATSIAYLRVLNDKGLLPDARCVAGHSLGEYTALVASGAIELADAARIVRRRGELMEQHGLGGMIAVIGLDEAVLRRISDASGAEIANFNAPGQITLSGRAEALAQATELARAEGAKRVLPLPVNGAFHSSLMAPVATELSPLIAETEVRRSSVPLIANVDARVLREPDELRTELITQITASVRWVDVVRTGVSQGVNQFCEVGPGKVLSGLIARIAPETGVVHAEALLKN